MIHGRAWNSVVNPPMMPPRSVSGGLAVQCWWRWLGSMGIYQTQWSAKRLCEIANTIKGKRRDVISKSSFGDLLHISPFVLPPGALVDFIVMRIDTKKHLLKLDGHRKIHFTRDMVKKIFNVPSGIKSLEFGKRGKANFNDVYLDGERVPIPTTIVVLSNVDGDYAETIDRSWRGGGATELNEKGGVGASATQILDVSDKSHTQSKLQRGVVEGAQGPSKGDMDGSDGTRGNVHGGVVEGAQGPSKGDMDGSDGTRGNVHEPPPDNMEGGDDVCGSLGEWLHLLPTFEELE
ncbi:hypothetical protein ZWY2020_037994, partial [Hordeum vulgare]